jgi:hypothetical protein
MQSQSLVYSVRSGWRRVSSLAWNRSLFRRLTTNPLLRLGIHPPDIDHRAIWKQIAEIVKNVVGVIKTGEIPDVVYATVPAPCPIGWATRDRHSQSRTD